MGVVITIVELLAAYFSSGLLNSAKSTYSSSPSRPSHGSYPLLLLSVTCFNSRTAFLEVVIVELSIAFEIPQQRRK